MRAPVSDTPFVRLRPLDRPDIKLPNGKTLRPRARIARDLPVHEKTLTRGNHPTVYVAGVAYLELETTLADIAGNLRRRNEPAKRRAGGRP
jgi:hypothetical protein